MTVRLGCVIESGHRLNVYNVLVSLSGSISIGHFQRSLVAVA